jgi:hypothetical protein
MKGDEVRPNPQEMQEFWSFANRWQLERIQDGCGQLTTFCYTTAGQGRESPDASWRRGQAKSKGSLQGSECRRRAEQHRREFPLARTKSVLFVGVAVFCDSDDVVISLKVTG